MALPSTRRRPLLLATAGGAAAVGAIGTATRAGLFGGAPTAGPSGRGLLQLSSGDAGIESLDLALDEGVLESVGPGRWRSAPLTTSAFSMVGFTWRRGEPEPHVDVQVRVDGAWQAWRRMPHAHDAPDPASDEVPATVGTDLVWVREADGIRLRVRGNLPAEVTLVLLHPAALPGDRAAAHHETAASGRQPAARAARAAPEDTDVPPPQIRRRRDWAADEGWRNGRPQYNDTIKQVHVHHTVNSNDYSRADVPALIRGMYRYHTHNLGWSDIGYNFLIDRFGRIWTGRAGGAERPVRGAHTLGFNASSTGVSVIGNYDSAAPTKAVIAAIARLAAWKLDLYDRDPQGRASVRSEGSDKYPSGKVVRLPVIDGHRDTNDTACPGQNLYDALPRVRRRTAARMDRFRQERTTASTAAQ